MKNSNDERTFYNTKLSQTLILLFAKTKTPLNLKQIIEKLKNQNYNKTTIYRKLETMENTGFLRGIDLPKSKVWELRNSVKHAHFNCKNCNKIECMDVSFSNLVTTNQIIETVLIGVCQECLE
jgi:Fur family transcriptional regulator, ferric uptake regulator